MSKENMIRLSLTKDYAKSWKIWEGLREIVQNWYDGLLSTIDHISQQITDSGQQCSNLECPVISKNVSGQSVEFSAHVHFPSGGKAMLGKIVMDERNNSLHLINSSTELARKVLLLGYSDKSERKEVIGQFGEGLKVGALALVREGRQLVMETQTDKWGFCMERDPLFEEQVLTVQVSHRGGEGEVDIDTSKLKLSPTDTCLTLYPLLPTEWGKFCRRFLFLETFPPEECIKSEAGWLLMGASFSGQLYVRQIWVADMSGAAGGMLAGVNLHRLRLDRDRRSVLHQSELDHTVSAMWTLALQAYPHLVPAYLGLLVEKGDNCCDTRHAGFYFDNRETARSLAREFLKRYGEQAYPLSSSGAPLSELKLEIGQNIVLCNNMLVDLLMRSGLFLSRDEYLRSQAAPGLLLLPGDTVPLESLSGEELSVLRHAVKVVKIVYPQFSVGSVEVTQQPQERITVSVEKFLEIPRWMLDVSIICGKFNTQLSQEPHCFAHGFLANSIFATMKQDAGSFPTNHKMVSGVTHGYAALLGSLISQSCGLVPPSCQPLHTTPAGELRWKEKEERTRALTESLESLKREMVGRESEVLRQYQSLQREVSALEEKLERGEEDFLNKQAALIQSYDDRMREAEVTSGKEINKLQEQLLDVRGELAHKEEVREGLRTALEEERASQARSSEVSKQKLERLRRMLVERSSALYELISCQGVGSSVSESRVRELSQLLQEEMEVLENQRLCVVCATEERAVVLLPCRHHQLCTTCAYQLNLCPSCRARITSRIKVFT